MTIDLIAFLLIMFGTITPATDHVVIQPVIQHIHTVAVDCEEDEAYIAVDYRDGDAVEDMRGVHRACRNVDQLIDWAIEVAIQEGVLVYTQP